MDGARKQAGHQLGLVAYRCVDLTVVWTGDGQGCAQRLLTRLEVPSTRVDCTSARKHALVPREVTWPAKSADFLASKFAFYASIFQHLKPKNWPGRFWLQKSGGSQRVCVYGGSTLAQFDAQGLVLNDLLASD